MGFALFLMRDKTSLAGCKCLAGNRPAFPSTVLVSCHPFLRTETFSHILGVELYRAHFSVFYESIPILTLHIDLNFAQERYRTCFFRCTVAIPTTLGRNRSSSWGWTAKR
ncbi:unnamed protein product, partial [Phaeothamnion confervicola]